MGLKVTNNAFGTLNAGINSSATTIVLTAGQGARFPTLSAGDYFYATLIDTSNNLEIVKVTARSTDTMTVVRGQDNTTARAYSTNDRFELRPTAVLFNETIDTANAALPKAGGTITGGNWIDFQNSQGTTIKGIRAVQFGYGSPYTAIQIGTGVSPQNLALGVDVTAIAGGNFSGLGKDIIVPNSVGFFTPNSGGTDFISPMRFDSAGRVLMPLHPAFHAYRTSGSSATGVFVWDATRFNRGSHYSTSTGRFTAPVAGAYSFSVTALPNSGSAVFYYIRKNGTQWGPNTYIVNPDETVSHTSVVELAANDYVDVFFVADGSEGAYTSFCGHFIG